MNFRTQKRKNLIQNFGNESDAKKVSTFFRDFWYILLKNSWKNREVEVLASEIKRNGYKTFFANLEITRDDCTYIAINYIPPVL